MGREIKRVPVDFDWPLEKIWPGYDYKTPDCGQDTCPEATDSTLPWSIEAMCAFHQAIWYADEYPKVDPPAGDGWQLWETVSEGSPISPVFAKKEGLIDWLCSPAYTWGLDGPMRKEQAERFVDVGSAPSMVFSQETGVVAGENWVGGVS